jgi:hypothetical protein
VEILLKYIDAITMTVAFIAVGLSATVRAYRGDPTSRGKVIVDLLNGTAIVPFAMCVFSDSLLKELTEHDKLILSTAGAMGLVFVIGEFIKKEQPSKKVPEFLIPSNVANNPSTGAKPDAAEPHSQP